MVSRPPSTSRKHRRHIIELSLFAVLVLALVGVALMLNFWPFRYREVHPLLERTFRSKVDVQRYRRTYFPHPGYVAEGVTFYRHGDMQIPPLATIDRMTVVGTWTNLIFHPHELYEIRLAGLHVQIPPAGTKARGRDFDQGMIAPSKKSIQIETIVADGSTLDFLAGHGKPPLRLQFSTLQVHNVQPGQPLSFSGRVFIPEPQGTVLANGSIGPFRTNDYGATPLSGTYSLQNANLGRWKEISGNAAASGRYNGTFSHIGVWGHAAVPNFRAGSAHVVRMDATYRVTVNGTKGDVEIQDVQLRANGNVISASGSVAGQPNKLAVTVATENSRVEDLLKIIEKDNPSVAGKVSFRAAVNLDSGQRPFLERLNLKGQISLAQITFNKPETQQAMNAFAARVQRDPPAAPQGDPAQVTGAASSLTAIHGGTAYFPDIRIAFPGTTAHLRGTFNLLDTRIHLTGKAALEQNISHAVTGWKSVMLKPMIPLFRHDGSGAIVSIAVTGTAEHPKIGPNLLHNK